MKKKTYTPTIKELSPEDSIMQGRRRIELWITNGWESERRDLNTKEDWQPFTPFNRVRGNTDRIFNWKTHDYRLVLPDLPDGWILLPPGKLLPDLPCVMYLNCSQVSPDAVWKIRDMKKQLKRNSIKTIHAYNPQCCYGDMVTGTRSPCRYALENNIQPTPAPTPKPVIHLSTQAKALKVKESSDKVMDKFKETLSKLSDKREAFRIIRVNPPMTKHKLSMALDVPYSSIVDDVKYWAAMLGQQDNGMQISHDIAQRIADKYKCLLRYDFVRVEKEIPDTGTAFKPIKSVTETVNEVPTVTTTNESTQQKTNPVEMIPLVTEEEWSSTLAEVYQSLSSEADRKILNRLKNTLYAKIYKKISDRDSRTDFQPVEGPPANPKPLKQGNWADSNVWWISRSPFVGHDCMVLSISYDGVSYAENDSVHFATWVELMHCFYRSDNRRTWEPCTQKDPRLIKFA